MAWRQEQKTKMPSFAQTNAHRSRQQRHAFHEWKTTSVDSHPNAYDSIKFITFAVINWNRKAPLCVRGENILELEANNFESSHNFSFQRKTRTIITRIHPTNPNIKHISNDDKDHEDPFQRSSRSPPVSHHSCKQLQCGIRRNRFCIHRWPQGCREFVLWRHFWCSYISIRVSCCSWPSFVVCSSSIVFGSSSGKIPDIQTAEINVFDAPTPGRLR